MCKVISSVPILPAMFIVLRPRIWGPWLSILHRRYHAETNDHSARARLDNTPYRSPIELGPY